MVNGVKSTGSEKGWDRRRGGLVVVGLQRTCREDRKDLGQSPEKRLKD